MFANGPGDRGLIPGLFIPKTQKWYLMPLCLTLSAIRYRSRVNWSNPGNGVVPSPRCGSYWKGSIRVPFDWDRQLYFYYIGLLFSLSGWELEGAYLLFNNMIVRLVAETVASSSLISALGVQVRIIVKISNLDFSGQKFKRLTKTPIYKSIFLFLKLSGKFAGKTEVRKCFLERKYNICLTEIF